jgi:hypothetical protein
VLDGGLLPLEHHHLMRRFWKKRGFWHGSTARLAWGLIARLAPPATPFRPDGLVGRHAAANEARTRELNSQ